MEVRTVGPANREETGCFKPGCSGNPNGRPQKTESERKADELFKATSLEAAQELISMAWDTETPVKIKVDILKHILDRALGKPKVSGELDVSASIITPADIIRSLDARLKGQKV
jgi:hypothetical protein